MFNKLKQFQDLKNQAKQMQNSLAQETISYSNHGINIVMNGNMEIIELTIEENTNSEKLAENLKNTLNSALKKAQKSMAQKMQAMGGLSNFGL